MPFGFAAVGGPRPFRRAQILILGCPSVPHKPLLGPGVCGGGAWPAANSRRANGSHLLLENIFAPPVAPPQWPPLATLRRGWTWESACCLCVELGSDRGGGREGGGADSDLRAAGAQSRPAQQMPGAFPYRPQAEARQQGQLPQISQMAGELWSKTWPSAELLSCESLQFAICQWPCPV